MGCLGDRQTGRQMSLGGKHQGGTWPNPMLLFGFCQDSVLSFLRVCLALAGHPHLPWAHPEPSVPLGTPTQSLT